jgi:outer membrane protein insertion porin family
MANLRRLFFRGLVSVCCLAGLARAVDITRIDVRGRGDRPVIPSTVLAFVQQAVGDAYEPLRVNRDIRRLQDTGRYAYVAAEIEREPGGIALIYVVEERPRLRRIFVEGGEHFSNAKIKDLLELNLSDRVDDALVRQHVEKVRLEYQKDFFPDVAFDIALSPPDAENYTELTLTVREGERQKVDRIRFTGNTEYTAAELKKAMKQKQSWVFSFLTGRGRYEDELLRQDMQVVEDLYRRKGYLDVKAGPPTVEKTSGGDLEVVVPIQTFDRYEIQSIRIQGNTLYPSSLLGAQVPLQVGDAAASDRIETGRTAIRDFYNNRGYSMTVVRDQWLLADKGRKVDVVYTIEEGRIATIRNVSIRGNTRTKDKVIRRELLVAPGDRLNEVNVRKSEARLRNLGFFSTANATMIPTEDKDVFDVAFDVEEGRSGQFVAGAGFSSVDDLIGFVELSQGNFDLFDPPNFTGGGDKIKLRLQMGTKRRDVEVTYSRPWFLNRRLTLNVSGFQNDRRFLSDDYDQRNTGGSVGIRRALGPLWRANLAYTLESIDVYNVDEDAPEIIAIEEGESMRSGMDLSFTRDTRNHVWVPTKGGRFVANTGFTGGPLGFDEEIYNAGLRSSYFVPVVWDHVLNLQGWVQAVDFYGDSERVPIFDRLFLGGARTVRGFEYREVSPVDEDENEVGGQTSMYATAEYTIPLSEVFRYALFYDWGVVNPESFEFGVNEINSSYGMGLRIDMPGFPLRFDYSFQDQSSDHNKRDSGRFSFLIGYSF